jgi:hypothetical protein
MNVSMRTRSYQKNGNVFFRDNTYSGTRGGSLWEMAPQLAALDPGYFHQYFDEFRFYDTTATVGTYAVVKDGAVVPLLLDAAGGVLSLPTDVNDNDEIYLSSIAENWLFAASKPLWFEARVALTEANTDDANIIVGLSDTVAANSLLDNGGGPMASYDGAVWFKVDGGTVWQFESSNAGTQVTTSSAGAFASNTWYRVGFIFDPGAGTTGKITPYLNGVAGTEQNITLAGLEEMHILLGAKAGGGNAETLRVDYVKVLQVR